MITVTFNLSKYKQSLGQTNNYYDLSQLTVAHQVSALFNKNFLLVQKHSVKRNPYEVIPVPYPTFTWCTPEIKHSFDTLRAEEAYLPNR